jgi:hypothetical protein
VVSTDSDPQSNGLSTHDRSEKSVPSSPPAGRRIGQLALAMLLAGLATLLIGWLAFLISRAGVAPAVLFPIGTGLAVGAAQTVILRKLDLSLPWFGAAIFGLLCGGLAVATEDYSGYRDYVGRYAEVQRGDRLASIVSSTTDHWQPAGFLAYLSAVIRRDPVWWSVDAVLTPLAAAAVAAATSRRARIAAAPSPGPEQPPPSPGSV